MALKPCPFCSNHISDKATKCPKCGAEISEKDFYKNVNARQYEGTSLKSFKFDEGPKARKSFRWWMIILLPVIIIEMLVGCILYLDNEEKKDEVENIRITMEKEKQDYLIAVRKEAERLEQLRQDSIKHETSNRKGVEIRVSEGQTITYEN